MMKLTQVRGNTWVIEAMALIPFYKLDSRRVILLDTGLREEGEAIEQTLLKHGLEPAGILCSHVHVDHCGNNRYFQEKYGIPVALTPSEAGMCRSVSTLKSYFLVLSPQTVEREAGWLVHAPDVLLPEREGDFAFAGATFHIVPTPGHSPGHTSLVTADNVCYTGDAMVSRELMGAKLPYHFNYAQANDSRERLRSLHCDKYILAHRDVCDREEFLPLIDDNRALIQQRAGEILETITRPMTLDQITGAVCTRYQLFTKKPSRALRFQRNIRLFLDFLMDEGLVELRPSGGVVWYYRV